MRTSISLLCLGFMLGLLLSITQRVLAAESKSLHTGYFATQRDDRQQPLITPTAAPRPALPQSAPVDPTLLYNNLLVSNLPPQSAEAGRRAVDGAPISPEVTNLANGGALTYANAPKPQACVTFDDLSKWASHVYADGRIQGNVWMDRYAGWSSFAVDDGGFYRSNNVTLGYDQAVGNRVSAKIASTQPYAAGFVSPPITVTTGAAITVRMRYLIVNPNVGRAAYDWVSLGIKPALEKDGVRYVNGYTHGRWAAIENTTVAEGDQVIVRLQAHSPSPQNSTVYLDDVEIFVNKLAVKTCEF